jgi:Hypoxia induced protein conserved region
VLYYVGADPQMRLARWLRFRVIAQGVTVAAAVVGGWQISQERRAARSRDSASQTEGEAKRANDQAEQARFSARLKEAEEAHRLETGSGVK